LHWAGLTKNWRCMSRTVFSSVAERNFRINCNQTKIYQPAGEFQDRPILTTIERCAGEDATLQPSSLRTSTMPKAEALRIFTPHGYNCTDRSLGLGAFAAPVWEITGFTLNRTVKGSDTDGRPLYQDEVEFTYNNTATDSDWPRNQPGSRTCYARTEPGGRPFDGSDDVNCVNYIMDAPGMRIDFRGGSVMMKLSQEWKCDGVDRYHT